MFSQEKKWMALALEEAKACLDTGDVPVGCVIVRQGEVIARGRNRREAEQNPLAHAEIQAIAQASQALGRWRLADCQLYVTLEPCPMCTGSIIMSKINAVYYGASEEKTGCCGSVINLFEESLGHHPRVYGGILAQESRGLLQEFFQNLR